MKLTNEWTDWVYVNDDHPESPNNMGLIIGKTYKLKKDVDRNYFILDLPGTLQFGVYAFPHRYYTSRLCCFEPSHEEFNNKLDELLK